MKFIYFKDGIHIYLKPVYPGIIPPILTSNYIKVSRWAYFRLQSSSSITVNCVVYIFVAASWV